MENHQEYSSSYLDIESLYLSNEPDCTPNMPVDNKKKRTKNKPSWQSPYPDFIAGSIPLRWIQDACKLGSSASRVAWICWHLYGLNKGGSFKISNIVAEKFGLSRAMKRNGLSLLNKEGLISINMKNGNAPIVKIIIRQIDKEKIVLK